MKIPPISNNTGKPAQPEKYEPKEVDGPRHAGSQPPEKQIAPSEAGTVQLSNEARVIRQRQSEITELQVARKAAERILHQEQVVEKSVTRMQTAETDTERVRARRDYEKSIESLRNEDYLRRPDNKVAENVLDGREMRYEVDNTEFKVRTPDSKRHVREFVKSVDEAVRNNRELRNQDHSSELRDFDSRAGDIQKRL